MSRYKSYGSSGRSWLIALKQEKFATQAPAELLREVRALAKEEGRQFQALVAEALVDLLEKRRNAKARPHVMSAYQASHARYASLYKTLAK